MKEFFWSTKVFSNEIFQYSETKPTENRDSPPLIQTFPIPEIIATVKDSPTKIFGTETKNFRRKILIHPPPSFIQIFSGPEVSETLKDSPTKFFGTVRQKNFDRKSWKSPPLLSINFFATGRFLKHSTEGFTYQIYRHCETKNFRRKNVIPPSMHKIFRYPKFSETLKVCSRNFSALWDKKFSTEKRDTP